MDKNKPVLSSVPTRTSIIRDMEKVFRLAMAEGKLGVALRAKALIGREMGIFNPTSKASKRWIYTLDEITESLMKEAVGNKLSFEPQHKALNND